MIFIVVTDMMVLHEVIWHRGTTWRHGKQKRRRGPRIYVTVGHDFTLRGNRPPRHDAMRRPAVGLVRYNVSSESWKQLRIRIHLFLTRTCIHDAMRQGTGRSTMMSWRLWGGAVIRIGWEFLLWAYTGTHLEEFRLSVLVVLRLFLCVLVLQRRSISILIWYSISWTWQENVYSKRNFHEPAPKPRTPKPLSNTSFSNQ